MLNEKQLQFCEEYALTYNGTDAYVKVYKQNNRRAAAVAANQMLKTSKIVDKIKELEGDYRIIGHKIGLNKEIILKRLKELLYAKKQLFYNGEQVGEIDDNPSANKALETILKIWGDFAPEKVEMKDEPSEIDVSKLTKKEIKEYKKRILKSL